MVNVRCRPWTIDVNYAFRMQHGTSKLDKNWDGESLSFCAHVSAANTQSRWLLKYKMQTHRQTANLPSTPQMQLETDIVRMRFNFERRINYNNP